MAQTMNLERFIQTLEAVQDNRALGARLAGLCREDVVLQTPWGQVAGAGEIELAALPVQLAVPDLRLAISDRMARPDGAVVVLRGVVAGRHLSDGVLGPAKGARIHADAMVELEVEAGTITRAMLIADSGAVLRQAGQDPAEWSVLRRVTPLDETDDSSFREDGSGWARAWSELVTRGLTGEDLARDLDPACQMNWAGGLVLLGADPCAGAWRDLRMAVPQGRVSLFHALGREEDLLAPRASVRWQLNGVHAGWGAFGAPSGAALRIDGMSMAEFGPDGVRRIWTLYDEAAVWAQIAEAADSLQDGAA